MTEPDTPTEPPQSPETDVFPDTWDEAPERSGDDLSPFPRRPGPRHPESAAPITFRQRKDTMFSVIPEDPNTPDPNEDPSVPPEEPTTPPVEEPPATCAGAGVRACLKLCGIGN